ncbi:MAG TPA: hypothetical protein VFY42_08030, partial [Gemmatimonadales bacterium]|nr:hypothetical protein [Gemmatimonadales bacterium]
IVPAQDSRPFNIPHASLGFGAMRGQLGALLIATALACVLAPVRALAQASPYIPLDDSRLPLLEHLIARGEIEDPSPMVRPFRRADAVRVLSEADTTESPSSLLIRRLRRDLADPPGNAWSIEARAGGQAFSHARRELLHPAGPSGARPYVEVRGAATFENLVLVTRPVIEPRLTRDPDWPGRRNVDIPGRMADAYVSAQFKYVTVFYGQLDRNWGPAGLPGIPLSNYGYERQGLALEVGNKSLRLSALATELHDEIDSVGQTVHRYYFVHRLHAGLSRRLSLALWEGVVLAGADRNFETRYRNPLSVTYLATTIGLGDRGNVLLGADVRWQAFGRTTLNAQLALDDFWYRNRQRNRDRWAFTLGADGPLLRQAAWHARYTQVSSLALRAFNPAENFTDAGVGIGRNFSDQDQLSLLVTLPVQDRWLLSPELTILRQGEGRINDPYPEPDPSGVLSTPSLFIGVVERTYRVAVGLSGRTGPLEVMGNAGFHHVMNSGHQRGRTDNRFEGRLQATLGFSRAGVLR